MRRVDVAFDLDLPHGRCVGLAIPDGAALEALAQGVLRPEERACAVEWAPARRRTWTAGRAALRLALERAGLEAPAVLPDDRGAPTLPEGVSASVSHKERLAVALVARETCARVGIDVEQDRAPRVDIARKVLTVEELAELADLTDAERVKQVLVRFSAKEAIYKALDPFVRRYVGFHEVAVTPAADGTAVVGMRLPEGPFRCEARWVLRDGIILTTARVEPCPQASR
jgi:enterobactin synthetase component D